MSEQSERAAEEASDDPAAPAGLVHVSTDMPGWTRRRAGRGFRYLDESGSPLSGEDVQRIRSLVIPPAWRDVWICPLPEGHLQATGVDAAGRVQYLYHPLWREARDREKFQRIRETARRLPEVRERIEADLQLPGLPLERATAVAVRLLDLGYFRIGNDYYTDENGSFGLTTLERRHARLHGGRLVFQFTGKSGVEHRVEVDDEAAVRAIQEMRRRRNSPRLLSYRPGSRWANLSSSQVNAYLSEVFEGDFTAKDFRTWHATVLAAAALAASAETGTSAASRKRAMAAAAREVSEYLGNTPTVARASYIDPRVLHHYEEGRVIDLSAVPPDPGVERQAELERLVLDLLHE